jgi:hypothetical protein
MNIKKARELIIRATNTSDSSFYQLAEDARTLKLNKLIQACEIMKQTYSRYQLINKLF